jgi:hypothetical protein
MAPLKQSKQSLLSLGLFIKNPSNATKKKHATLVKKCQALPKKRKTRVDKKAAQRIAEEQDLICGAGKWRDFLLAIGMKDAERFRCDILYQSNGEAPDPIVYLKEKEKDNAEFETRFDYYRNENI